MNRVRPLLTVLLIASYLTAPVMAVPHAHGERWSGDSTAHDARPHVHIGSHPEHRHDHDDHHHDDHHHHAVDHRHAANGAHHHPPAAVTSVDAAASQRAAKYDAPTVWPAHSHDADAVYVSSLVGAGRSHTETSPIFSDFAVAAVVQTYVAPAGLDCRARYWHPPSGASDGIPLYLKLRSLRI